MPILQYNLQDFCNWLKINKRKWSDEFIVHYNSATEDFFYSSFSEWVEKKQVKWDNLNSFEWLRQQEIENYPDPFGSDEETQKYRDKKVKKIIKLVEKYKGEIKISWLEQEKKDLETKSTQQKKIFNQVWSKKLELEKLKNELINKENEEQQELLISPLETQEQITRLKSELENSSRTIFLAKKQLERIKEKLKKEEINEGELEIIRRPQEEMIKLQMELGIEEETEKYEVHQEVPLSSNQT